MRSPDDTEEINSKGFKVLVETWIEDDTDIEWDGDYELPPGSTCHWVMVRCTLEFDGSRFTDSDSMGGIWKTQDTEGDKFLQESVEEVRHAALANLWDEVEAVSKGRDVTGAQLRMSNAVSVWNQKK